MPLTDRKAKAAFNLSGLESRDNFEITLKALFSVSGRVAIRSTTMIS
jgi:hypothetical protein